MQRRTALFVVACTCAIPAFALYDPKPEEWLSTVYSYERMRFDLAGSQVVWSTGADGKPLTHAITSDTNTGKTRTVVFGRKEEGELKRFTFEASSRSLRLSEEEVAPTGLLTFRNRYEFSRTGT